MKHRSVEAEARGIARGLSWHANAVGKFIPSGFEAYARIMHPLQREVDGETVLATWNDVAASHGRTVDEELLQLDAGGLPIEPYESRIRWQARHLGSLPYSIVKNLVELFRPSTPDHDACRFAVWDGWGDLREFATPPFRFSIPGRDMLLFEGPLDRALESCADGFASYRSPNLWWSADLSWFVATEIDFFWTYVGASRDIIGPLLEDPSIEAYGIGESTQC